MDNKFTWVIYMSQLAIVDYTTYTGEDYNSFCNELSVIRFIRKKGNSELIVGTCEKTLMNNTSHYGNVFYL